MKASPFNKRAFVALVSALVGLGLPITGLANHFFETDSMVVPRHLWMSAHGVLGIVFVVFVIWHALLNGRALVNYARDFAVRRLPVSLEALSAVVLVAAMLMLALVHAFLEE